MVILLQVFGPVAWWVHIDPCLWPTTTYHERISQLHSTIVLKALMPEGLPDLSFFQLPDYRLVLLYSSLFHTDTISSASPSQSYPASFVQLQPSTCYCCGSLSSVPPKTLCSLNENLFQRGDFVPRHHHCKTHKYVSALVKSLLWWKELSLWGLSFLWKEMHLSCGSAVGSGSALTPPGMLACWDFTQISTKCSVNPSAVYLMDKFLLMRKISHLTIRMLWKPCGFWGMSQVSPSRELVLAWFCFLWRFNTFVYMH